MKFSESLIKTRREKVKEADSINADLLIRGSYIDQLASGVYTYLPLGLKTIEKISSVIRDEINKIQGQEILMPVLQPKENWQKTGRWETEDNLYIFTSYYSKTDLVLGPTHEEVVVPLAKKFIFSYKDLPKYLYQIQNKFRDEKRAKGGLLRGREFIMKDLYSFHSSKEDLDDYYEKASNAYKNIFNKVGIGSKTYKTFASGGSFSKYSHEFQTESDSGEDLIYLCKKCKVAVNKEIINEQSTCPECGNPKLTEIKAIEVGNIFKLMSKFSAPFGLTYRDRLGEDKPILMGCYGIGLGRLMGAIVEVSHDKDGLIWPIEIAPFKVHLINMGDNREVLTETKRLYEKLMKKKIEVIWDDRSESNGVKLTDADLIGIPIRLIISNKTLESKAIELKERARDNSEMIQYDNILTRIKEIVDVK